MTDAQVVLAQALERCTFQIGSPDKRFAREMAARSRVTNPQALTDRQSAYLARLAWRYRRQLPRDLAPADGPS